jgi:hypothetical protein
VKVISGNGTWANQCEILADLSTGTKISNACSGSSTNSEARIHPAGNGWYRLSVRYTLPSSDTMGMGSIYTLNAAGSANYTGDDVSGIYVWGAQFEQNLSPSSYLPTTSAARFDSPRFDYDPVTLEPKGLMAEGARTNLLAGNFLGSGVSNLTYTANAATAPDGTTTASRYSCNVNGSNNDCWIQRQVSVTSSSTMYSYSVFLKQGTSPTTLINLLINGGTGVQSVATVTWGATPTVSIASLSGGAAYGSIAPSSNGWYRVSLSQADNASGNNTLYVRVYTRNQAASNVSGDTALVWGPQVETGTSSTSYIPTTTVAGTRNADSISFANVGWYSDTAGTLEIDALTSRYLSDGSFANTYIGIFGIINAGLTEGVRIAFSGFASGTNPTPRLLLNAAGNNQNLYPSIPTQGTYSKFGAAFTTGDFSVTVNDTAPITSSSGGMPGTMSSACLGSDCWNSSNTLNGWIKKFTYFNSRLSDDDLRRRTQ